MIFTSLWHQQKQYIITRHKVLKGTRHGSFNFAEWDLVIRQKLYQNIIPVINKHNNISVLLLTYRAGRVWWARVSNLRAARGVTGTEGFHMLLRRLRRARHDGGGVDAGEDSDAGGSESARTQRSGKAAPSWWMMSSVRVKPVQVRGRVQARGRAESTRSQCHHFCPECLQCKTE